jgi:hypothetical protein
MTYDWLLSLCVLPCQNALEIYPLCRSDIQNHLGINFMAMLASLLATVNMLNSRVENITINLLLDSTFR